MNSEMFQDHVKKIRKYLDTLPEGAYELELRLQVIALRLLAKGKPVSPKELAQAWGMPMDQVSNLLAFGETQGSVQLNEQGNMIGSFLSLEPTRHSMLINGNKLFAWCAYDSVYIPAVIGEEVLVESMDPVTGEEIVMKVSPEGILEVKPEGTVATVVGLDTDARGGVDSPRCRQMNFFASVENAEKWTEGNFDVAVMSPGQMFELAKMFQMEPARKMGL